MRHVRNSETLAVALGPNQEPNSVDAAPSIDASLRLAATSSQELTRRLGRIQHRRG